MAKAIIITAEQSDRIKEWLSQGKTQKEMALNLGVSQPTISRIVNRLKTFSSEQQTQPESVSTTTSETQEFSAPPRADVYGDMKSGPVRI